MLEKLSSYVLMITSLAVICALFEYLIPEGRLKKTVLFCIGILFLIGIASPLMDITGIGNNEDIFLLDEPVLQDETGGDFSNHEELLKKYYQSIMEE